MKRFFALVIAVVLLTGMVSACADNNNEPTIPLYPGSSDAENGGEFIANIQRILEANGYYVGQYYQRGVVDDATSAAYMRYCVAMGVIFNPHEISVVDQKMILNNSIRPYEPEEPQETPVPGPTPFTSFRLGDSAAEINDIQIRLSEAGYFDLAGERCTPGVFDEATMKALKTYLEMWNFQFYGIIDENIYRIITKDEKLPAPKVTPTPTPAPSPTVFIGYAETGDNRINELQARLEQLGYLEVGHYTVGTYDENLQKALYVFCDVNTVNPDPNGINHAMYTAIMSQDAKAKPIQPIHLGDKSDTVEQLQKNLYTLNCYTGLERSGNICDGAMMQAVRRFAEANNISFDGFEITAAIQNAILGEKATAWVQPKPEKQNWFMQKADIFGMKVARFIVVIIAVLIAGGVAVLFINTFSGKNKGAASGRPFSGEDAGANVELEVTYQGMVLGRYRKNITTPIHIGRGFNVIPLNPNDMRVSKNHCQLSYHDNTLFLRDFSRNGSRINGISVHNGENVVRNNAEIEIGDHIIKVKLL